MALQLYSLHDLNGLIDVEDLDVRDLLEWTLVGIAV
jgi:hypothetical protein